MEVVSPIASNMEAMSTSRPLPPKSAPSVSSLPTKRSSNDDSSDSDDSDEDAAPLQSLKKDGELKDLNGMLSLADSDEMGVSIFKEVWIAFKEARYLGTFLAFIGLFIGYQLTIAPYRISSLDRSFNTIGDFGLIRPVIDDHQQASMRHNLMHGETAFILPEPYYDDIKVRFHKAVDKEGAFEPPQLFYEGVMFGITDNNSHDLRYTGHKEWYKSRHLLEEKQTLESKLNSMRPKPTFIAQRKAQHNDTAWEEDGFAVYFSYKDLQAQGKLSSDKLAPWKRVMEDVLEIAREFRQVSITAWYPHEYGEAGDNKKEQKRIKKQPNRFTSIIQQIIPTRTGLRGIKSTVPVWMSAINKNTPRRKLVEHPVIKEWSEDDHWTHYKPGGSKYVKYTKEDLEEMDYKLHKGVQAIGSKPPEDEESLRTRKMYEGTSEIITEISEINGEWS
jgi:hypothetical protein